MMTQVVSGFLDGFFETADESNFGGAFTVTVKLDGDESGKPININLESCLADNLPFFQNILATMASAYHSKRQEGEGGEGSAKDVVGTGAMMVMMQAPSALARCNVGEEQRELLISAVKAFGAGMHASLETRELVDRVRAAIVAFKHKRYAEFGRLCGRTSQGAVLTMFPQKYTLDATGLHARLADLGPDVA